jgi:AcrR family transcriptional regulator
MKMTAKKESRGAATRERIIEEAVQIFSIKGFYNTSLDDILQAAKLSKGGFFCHFESKEELGFAALDKAVAMWREKVLPLLESKSSPLDKLLALIDGHRYLAENRTFKGGCFFLTLATEMDDQHELFRKRLGEIYDQWRDFIIDILEEGKKKGVFKKGIHPEESANLIIATVEGSVLLSKIRRDTKLFLDAMQNLKNVIVESLTA